MFTRRGFLKAGAMTACSLPALRFAFAQEETYLPAVPGRPEPPPSPYGFESTAEEVTDGMDLSGLNVLVTGCNSGLGYETMRVLAMRGAHVIGAARTTEKAEEACASVSGHTTPIVIELTEFDTIVAAAETVRSMDAPLDRLILNAGIMALQQLEHANGVEKQFAVNHLGHFLLTEHLIPAIRRARQGRVVVVSSGAYRWAPEEGIQFDNLDGSQSYAPFTAYGQSKLANALFSRELARRLADSPATSNSLHPGVIQTNLSRHLPPREDDGDSNSSFRYKTIPQGTATQCYLATAPELAEVTGYYFADCAVAYPDERMQDDEAAARLWAVSEELTRGYRHA